MTRIVVHPAIDSERLEKVRTAAGTAEVIQPESLGGAREAMASCTGFFGKITPELLLHARQLRWVQAPTASLEHYVFPELVEHSCTLTNMRGLFGDVIADHVLGYVLCFARNFLTYWRQQREERWEPVGGESSRTSFASGPGTVSAMDRAHLHLADATMGIVGLGCIGREIARRAAAFGMRVVGVDPRVDERMAKVERVWPVEQLAELLAVSDFVVIAAPHTPTTAGLFGQTQLEQMKRSAYLINIGRGAIVRLEDLVRALQNQVIAGAALDVFEVEPLPPAHPLWQLPNVILTPHVAAASPRIAERHLAVLLDNVGRFVRGEPLLNVVNKREWY